MSVYVNPYDFTKPVKDPKLFAGRRKELDEIDYYLGLTLTEKPTYHNLSLIGQRAAGKTSLLNMIQYMAEKEGLLAVKISLNNETSTNEVLLFKEIFDGIMTLGVQKGMFDGVTGKIYRMFRKVIDTLEVETELPFLFGTAYIGTKKQNNNTISQHVLNHDLKKFYDEAKDKGIRAIILLFDECDLLASSQTLLQKLRNVFSDIDGYMLIFSGTEKMFPAMTETFSPIPRLFKRIDVENFKKIEETKECILNRLSDDEKKLVNDQTVAEVHLISNGSPYEVQLVSHFMYKKFKEKNSANIVINTDVLDEVMNEIERLRKDKHGTIANQIKHCNRYQLNVLRSILEFPNTTSEQLSTFMVLSELDSVDIKDLSSQKSYYNLLIKDLKSSILKEENGFFNFAGDQFDVLYLKYHLFSNGIADFVFGRPDDPDMPVEYMLTKILLKDIPAFQSNTRFDRSVGIKEPEGRTTKKLSFGGKFPPKPGVKPGEWTTIFEFSFQDIEEKFYRGTPKSIRFRVNVDFLKTGFVTQYIFDNEEHVKLAKQRLDSLKTKLELLGIKIISKDEIEWTYEGTKMTNEKKYAESLQYYDEAIRINPEYELAWANKNRAYFIMGDYENSLKSAKKWCDIRPTIPTPWEDQGKCFIHLKRFQDALNCLDKAVKFGPEAWSAWDNRGRALLNLRRLEEAIESFDKAISLKADDYDAIFFKGVCLSNLKRDKESLECCEFVLQHKPDHDDALLYKAISLHHFGKDNDALIEIEKLEQKLGDNIAVMDAKSLILDGLGRQDEAIEYCNKILEKDTNNPATWYNRACFKVKKGNTEDGLSDLKQAILLGKDCFIELAKQEKDFANIRNDQRFLSLISIS